MSEKKRLSYRQLARDALRIDADQIAAAGDQRAFFALLVFLVFAAVDGLDRAFLGR